MGLVWIPDQIRKTPPGKGVRSGMKGHPARHDGGQPALHGMTTEFGQRTTPVTGFRPD